MESRRLWRNFDWFLLLLVLVLSGLGVVMIASATHFRWEVPGTWDYVTRQLTWVGLSVAAMIVVVSLDYQIFRRWFRFLYFGNMVMLAAVLVIGTNAMGAQRWISIGPFQLQPSEFSKILIILTLAEILARQDGVLKYYSDLFMPALHILLPMGLIILQPDLGTSMVFVAIAMGMVYMAGFSGWKQVGLMVLGFSAAAGWVTAHLRWGLWIPLQDYQLRRLLVFLDPTSDPFGAGYHIIQARIAIGSGKLWGQGLFEGTQNQMNYLPEQQTDFIFAVVGEELGFAGGAFLILLLALILLRSMKMAARARDVYGFLVIAGCVSMVGFHVLVNIGMAMGIMPVTGIPLPFISYGGSSLMTNYIAMGLILNVYMRRRKILF